MVGDSFRSSLDKVLDLTAGSREGSATRAGLKEGRSVVDNAGN